MCKFDLHTVHDIFRYKIIEINRFKYEASTLLVFEYGL